MRKRVLPPARAIAAPFRTPHLRGVVSPLFLPLLLLSPFSFWFLSFLFRLSLFSSLLCLCLHASVCLSLLQSALSAGRGKATLRKRERAKERGRPSLNKRENYVTPTTRIPPPILSPNRLDHSFPTACVHLIAHFEPFVIFSNHQLTIINHALLGGLPGE